MFGVMEVQIILKLRLFITGTVILLIYFGLWSHCMWKFKYRRIFLQTKPKEAQRLNNKHKCPVLRKSCSYSMNSSKALLLDLILWMHTTVLHLYFSMLFWFFHACMCVNKSSWSQFLNDVTPSTTIRCLGDVKSNYGLQSVRFFGPKTKRDQIE